MMNFKTKIKDKIHTIYTTWDESGNSPLYFEPKTDNRFIIRITDDDQKEIIPSFTIYNCKRPSFSLSPFFKTKIYEPLIITLYDPIVPSNPRAIYEAIDQHKKWNIEINVLGPVGDSIEHWNIYNAKLENVKFSSLNWKGDDHTFIILKFHIRQVYFNY